MTGPASPEFGRGRWRIVYPGDVKTAELHLDDWAWKNLQAAARRQGVAVPQLIRAAVEEKYLHAAAERRIDAFRKWVAPWRDRDDFAATGTYIRGLRRGHRLKQLYPV